MVSHDTGPPCTTTPCDAGYHDLPSTPPASSLPIRPGSRRQGLYGVTLNIVAPGSGYTYSLSGLPSAGHVDGLGVADQLAQNPAGCNLASPGGGYYEGAVLRGLHRVHERQHEQHVLSGRHRATDEAVHRRLPRPPAVLRERRAATTCRPTPFRRTTTRERSGYNSEAYLGNNGFYTGIPGNPALYQLPNNGAYTVVTFTNIEVTNAVGEPATGWTLVTGDAESTDSGEWINFTTNNTWSILPNTAASLYGNSCYDAHDTGNSGLFQWTGPLPPTDATVGNAANGPPAAGNATTLATPAPPNYLTGVSSILCESDQQLNKTGTLMLASPEPPTLAPQSVTVTMQGCGIPGPVPRSAAVRRPAAFLRRAVARWQHGSAPSARDRFSEEGDTLIEVLLSIVVLGIAAVALLTGFATAITASGEHRNLASLDSSTRIAANEAIADVQQQAQNPANNPFVCYQLASPRPSTT